MTYGRGCILGEFRCAVYTHVYGCSKEKYSEVGYNLACILTFPAYQRKGYGRFLISMSYELSKKEQKVGSPEKPLSDLGAISYKSYWSSVIIRVLESWEGDSISIMDIAKLTSFVSDDIILTLQNLGFLKSLPGGYVIICDKEKISLLKKEFPVREPQVDPSKLYWAPLVVDRKAGDQKFYIKNKRPASGDPYNGGSSYSALG